MSLLMVVRRRSWLEDSGEENKVMVCDKIEVSGPWVLLVMLLFTSFSLLFCFGYSDSYYGEVVG